MGDMIDLAALNSSESADRARELKPITFVRLGSMHDG